MISSITGYIADAIVYIIALAMLVTTPLTICFAILQVFGVMWMPVSGIICAIIAYRRRLNNIVLYTFVGIFYSMLFFIPWLYLIKRMRGDNFSNITIRSSYQILFATWGGVLCAYMYIIYEFLIDEGEIPLAVMAFSFTTLIISAVTMVLTGMNLIRRDPTEGSGSGAAQKRMTIPLLYLMPIVLLFLSVLLLWLMIHLALCWILGSCLLDFVCVVEPLCYSSLTFSEY